MWDTETKLPLRPSLVTRWYGGRGAAFSPDSKKIAIRGPDGDVMLLDNSNSVGETPDSVGLAPVTEIELSRNSKWLAAGTSSGEVEHWDMASRRSRRLFSPSSEEVAWAQSDTTQRGLGGLWIDSLAFNFDNKILAIPRFGTKDHPQIGIQSQLRLPIPDSSIHFT